MGVRRRRVIWSEGARRELDEAVSYVAEESLDSAIRLLERILESAQSSGLVQTAILRPDLTAPYHAIATGRACFEGTCSWMVSNWEARLE